MLVQISAAQGPAECARAVWLAQRCFVQEAEQAGLRVSEVEQVTGPVNQSLASVLMLVRGDGAEAFMSSWRGTVLWRCQSPYRPRHKRKNWYIGITAFETDEVPGTAGNLAESDIRFEACRASGPGGQHVNRTDSAVRATHIPSGISVKAQTERSQHANKRLARALIALKLEQASDAASAQARARQHEQHSHVERGNPVRVYEGVRFQRQA